MTDRHADARRIAGEICSVLGSPLDFTLKLFLAGAKDIIIPDHVFLHQGKVRGLLRYTMSTSTLSFDPQWPAIDVSQTSESLFSHKAVDLDMQLNQTISRHFNSRLGPAMMFLPCSSPNASMINNNTSQEQNASASSPSSSSAAEYAVTARYFAKESIFDVVGELRAQRASGILMEYRTPLDGYHNLLRATFTPFLLVLEMRRSKHNLREHQIPLKLRVSTGAQNGNVAKEVQVPPSAQGLVCDMLNALVSKKEESGEFVERCVAYFSVISPKLVMFLWCSQMNVMPLEHANQLSEEVTSLQPTQQQQQLQQQQEADHKKEHQLMNAEEEERRKKKQQLKAARQSQSHQQQQKKETTSSSNEELGNNKMKNEDHLMNETNKSTATTTASASSPRQQQKHQNRSLPGSATSSQHRHHSNMNNTSRLSSATRKRLQHNNTNLSRASNDIHNHPYQQYADTDQSYLSPRLLQDMKVSPERKIVRHHHRNLGDEKNTTADQTQSNDDDNNSTNEDQQQQGWDESHYHDKEYIREHSIIHQMLPSSYSAMRDEKSFVSSLRRVRENYHSTLTENEDGEDISKLNEKNDEEFQQQSHVRNLATVAAARKVAKMFGVAKEELPPKPVELSLYKKVARAEDDYSASRIQNERKKGNAKRKLELDKLALALSRAKERREDEERRLKKNKTKKRGSNDQQQQHHQQENNVKEEEEGENNNNNNNDNNDNKDDELLDNLPSAAKHVKLLPDSEFDLRLAEIQDQTYDRFDCGMSGYIIDMPAHYLFSKYGVPRFNYYDGSGSDGGGGGGNGGDYSAADNGAGGAPPKSLLDQLLQPGSIRYQKRKERQARNAPPLVPVEPGKTFIEQTVSSKLGGDLLSSRLLSSAHHRQQQRHREASSPSRDKNNNNIFRQNTNRQNEKSKSKTISEMLFSNIKQDESIDTSLMTTQQKSSPSHHHLNKNTSRGSSSTRKRANVSGTNTTMMNDSKEDEDFDVETYLNSTAASRHRLRKQRLLQAQQRGDDEQLRSLEEELEHDDDALSQASSDESQELLEETTGNQTAPGAGAGSNAIMKSIGLTQEESAHLTYTVQKIRTLGEAIFQTTADLLYRACSQQAARRAIVEVVIPFGYRHLDQELRSTFLTLGLEEQPIESLGRIAEFRTQHENDGTSFGELAMNNPIGEAQSMFDDDNYTRQSNGAIASLRDEWYSLDGGGSVVFVLQNAQTAVPRAERFLRTLEQELTPLSKFGTPLCTPKDIECCSRVCELVADRGFTICDATNVLATERQQKIVEEEEQQQRFSSKHQQQQRQRKKRS